jgi:hypothetical protein
MDKVYVEMLIGHDTQVAESRGKVNLAVSRHYDRGLPLKAVEQYIRAMPFLSIDEAYRKEAALAEKLEEAEKARDEDIKDLRYALLAKDKEMGDMRKTIEQLSTIISEIKAERLRELKKSRPPDNK